MKKVIFIRQVPLPHSQACSAGSTPAQTPLLAQAYLKWSVSVWSRELSHGRASDIFILTLSCWALAQPHLLVTQPPEISQCLPCREAVPWAAGWLGIHTLVINSFYFPFASDSSVLQVSNINGSELLHSPVPRNRSCFGTIYELIISRADVFELRLCSLERKA